MSIFIYINLFVQINLGFLEVNALGRKNEVDAVALGLNVDSGLGIFDAFIASLSMILVSEVCAQNSWHCLHQFYCEAYGRLLEILAYFFS